MHRTKVVESILYLLPRRVWLGGPRLHDALARLEQRARALTGAECLSLDFELRPTGWHAPVLDTEIQAPAPAFKAAIWIDALALPGGRRLYTLHPRRVASLSAFSAPERLALEEAALAYVAPGPQPGLDVAASAYDGGAHARRALALAC